MANYTLQSHGGEGLYMTADGTPTARRNVYQQAGLSWLCCCSGLS